MPLHGQGSPPLKNSSTVTNVCAHTHSQLTQHNKAHCRPAKCLPCSTIIIWQSATTLKSLCFRQCNLKTTLFLWGLTAFHWGKNAIYNKDI